MICVNAALTGTEKAFNVPQGPKQDSQTTSKNPRVLGVSVQYHVYYYPFLSSPLHSRKFNFFQ